MNYSRRTGLNFGHKVYKGAPKYEYRNNINYYKINLPVNITYIS